MASHQKRGLAEHGFDGLWVSFQCALEENFGLRVVCGVAVFPGALQVRLAQHGIGFHVVGSCFRISSMEEITCSLLDHDGAKLFARSGRGGDVSDAEFAWSR